MNRKLLVALAILWPVAASAQTSVVPPSENPHHVRWANLVGDCDPATELCCLRQVGCALLVGSGFIDTGEGTAFNRMRTFHAFLRSLENSWQIEACPREVQLAYYFYRPAAEEGPQAVGNLLSMPADTLLGLFESFEVVAEALGPDVWPAGALCPEPPSAPEAEIVDPDLKEAVRLSQEAGRAHEQGRLAEARELRSEAADLYEAEGDLVALAAELTQLVLLADAQRDHEAASEFGRRAAELYEKLEMPAELAMAHLMNGASFAEQALFRKACGELTRARELFESLESSEIEKVAQIEDFAGCSLPPEALVIREKIARAGAESGAGEYAKAAQTYGEAVKLAEEALGKFEGATIESLAGLHGSHAYVLIFARQFEAAEAAARQGLSLDPSQTWIYTNLAHALMFQGKLDPARALYAKYTGTSMPDERLWEEVIRDDFEELREAGLTDDLMDEVLERFGAP